jgi:hypothetical protein
MIMRERFDRSVERWRFILTALPEHGITRITAFMAAADEASVYVYAGLDRLEARDELQALASRCGLADEDAIKWIITRALDD